MKMIKISMTILFAAMFFLSSFAMAEEKETKKEAAVLEPIEVIGEKIELFRGKVFTERIDELQSVDIGELLKRRSVIAGGQVTNWIQSLL